MAHGKPGQWKYPDCLDLDAMTALANLSGIYSALLQLQSRQNV
jgi:hypothetical protein